MFDGYGAKAGKVYIGTAAHCVSGVGQEWSSGANVRFGKVAYRGDYPNSVNGGPAVENGIPGTQLDFALIEVYDAFKPAVTAEVRGHPGMPNGTTTWQTTAQGDLLLLSGYGTGFGSTAATREERVGILWSDGPTAYRAEAPITPGDSGGPVLHQSGRALGVVSGFGLSVSTNTPPLTWYGPTVQGIVNEVTNLGFPIDLREA